MNEANVSKNYLFAKEQYAAIGQLKNSPKA